MLVSQVLPVKVRECAFLVVNLDHGYFHLRDILPFQASQMMAYNSTNSVQIIYGDLNNGWNKLLKSYNISLQSLPGYLGGHLSDNFFDDYIRTRLSVEDIMGSAPPIANTRLATFPSSITIMDQVVKCLQHDKKDPSMDRDAVRRRNAEYQRNWVRTQEEKRHSLREQCRALTTRKAQLQEEQTRLRDLLEEAKSLVSKHTANLKDDRSASLKDDATLSAE